MVLKQLNSNSFYPIETTFDTDSGSRIGGKAPKHVAPAHSSARYFATLVFDEDLELSIFLNFDFGTMWDNAFRIIYPTDSLVEVIVHQQIGRSNSDQYQSELSACGLKILALKEEEKPEPYGWSKLGGTPYIIRERNNLSALVANIIGASFIQFIQL